MRGNLTEEDKKEIGIQCCNCGSTQELEYHHVVPIGLGGKDINSNIVCLYYPCHQKILYGENKYGLHSTVIKMGLDVTKKKGKKLGRPATGVPKEFIKEYNKNSIWRVWKHFSCTVCKAARYSCEYLL